MSVFAPVTAFGQWAILPLGATLAEGAGTAEALAVADAVSVPDAEGAVPDDDELQSSHPVRVAIAISARARERERRVDRKGTSGDRSTPMIAQFSSEITNLVTSVQQVAGLQGDVSW
jgi:hypothetical protein